MSLLVLTSLLTVASAAPQVTPTPTKLNEHSTHVGVRSLWTHGPDLVATPVPSGADISTRCALGVPLLYISDDEADCIALAFTDADGVQDVQIQDPACAASVSSAAYHGFYPLTGCWQWEGYYKTILSLSPPGETLTVPPSTTAAMVFAEATRAPRAV